MFRPVRRVGTFTSALALVIALTTVCLAGVSSAQAPTKLAFKRWTVVIEHGANKNVGLGKSFEHCASETVTTIAAAGKLTNAEKGAPTVERWFRDGKLFHAFHLSWGESGSGSYTTYGLGSDDGLKDGSWKVEKAERGHSIGTATIKLVSDPSC